MKYDIKHALTYYFKDKWIIPKTLIAYVFVIMSSFSNFTKNHNSIDVILITLLIGLIGASVMWGYQINNVHERTINPDAKIPGWSNILNYFKHGFLFLIASLIYTIPVLAVLAGSVFAAIALSVDKQPLVFGLCFLIVFVVLLVMAVIFTIKHIVASKLAYSIDFNVKSFFNKKTLGFMIKENKNDFEKVIVISIIASILMVPVIILLALTIVGLLLVPAVSFFIYLFYSEIEAQFLRHALKKEQSNL